MKNKIFRIKNTDPILFQEIAKIHAYLPNIWDQVSTENIQMTIRSLMKQSRESRLILICATDPKEGQLIGYCWGERDISQPERLLIISTWVDKDFRNQKLATKLKKKLESYSKESGVRVISTCVSPQNKEMISLNESLGYTVSMVQMDKQLS